MGKYTGVLCECCHRAFSEEDDVVVCPECGAPHHRECYKQLGRCALSDKHGEGFAWKVRLPEDTDSSGNTVSFCRHCNSVNPAGAKYCVMCGTPLSESYQGGVNSRRHSEEQGGYYSESYSTYEDDHAGDFVVDGVNSRELIAYTGNSFHYYLRNFKRILSGSSISWNWGAFLFTFFYFFYRKMYKVGIVLLALRLLSFVPAVMCYIIDPDTSMQLMGATVYYNAALTARLTPVSSFLNTLVSISHVFCAFFANKFYLKSAVRDIRRYKESGFASEGTQQYYDDIYYLGKPSVISIIVIIMSLSMFYSYIGSLFTITY